MNLIEQLGGYEAAKGLFNLYEYSISFKYYKVFKGDFESAGYIDVFIPDLQKALLEYRRQHNVYEADDLVVFVDEKERKPVLLKFKESRNFDLVHLEIIGSGLCGPSYQKEIRHATDEEIKAGKRLEVK